MSQASTHRDNETVLGGIQCFHCDKICNSSRNLYGHIKVAHLPKTEPWVCCMCLNKFKTIQYLHKHYRFYHLDKLLQMRRTIYQCKYCEKKYFTKPGLMGHENAHSGKTPYECETCKDKFSSSYLLFKHNQDVHRPKREHACPLCGKSYKYRRSLDTHRIVHKNRNERLYKCTVCEKGFNYKKNLHKHYLTHKETRYMCTLCERTFSKKFEMKSHVKSAHKPTHNCPHCSKTFEKKLELKKHSKIHKAKNKRKETKDKRATRKKKRKRPNESKK